MPRSRWGADIRYAGQGYDLTSPIDRGRAARNADRRGPRRLPRRPPASLWARVREPTRSSSSTCASRAACPGRASIARLVAADGRAESSRSICARGGRPAGTCAPVFGRADLRTPLVGPALVEEFDTTTVVPPGWSARLDDLNSIVMEHVR